MLAITISVIIPIFNGEKYLKQCMDSVVSQTLERIQIICVDDGSTDNSLHILRKYNKNNIEIYQQGHQGPAKARNIGLEKAQGKYVCFMDVDDWYPNEKILELLYKSAEKHKAKICGGSFSMLRHGKMITKFVGQETGYTFNRAGWKKFKDYQFDYGYQRFIFDRMFLAERNINFPPLLRYQDPPFLIGAMLAAENFFAIPQVVYCYRVAENDSFWTREKVLHMLSGIDMCLQLAKENTLDVLAQRNVCRINDDYFYVIRANCEHEDVIQALWKIQKGLDIKKQNKKFHCRRFLLKPLYALQFPTADLAEYPKECKYTFGYKLMSVLLWFPQKVAGFFRCWHKHGFRFLMIKLFFGIKKAIQWEEDREKKQEREM